MIIILQLGTNLLTLEYVFHDTYLRSNLFKDGRDDTNQIRSEFDLKMFVDQFCEIRHICQTVYRNEL